MEIQESEMVKRQSVMVKRHSGRTRRHMGSRAGAQKGGGGGFLKTTKRIKGKISIHGEIRRPFETQVCSEEDKDSVASCIAHCREGREQSEDATSCLYNGEDSRRDLDSWRDLRCRFMARF